VGGIESIITRLAIDPEFKRAAKDDPEKAFAQLLHEQRAPLESDTAIYRIVVSALGLAVVGAIVGAVLLSIFDKDVPEVLTALGSAAVGALAGLLAPSPHRQKAG